MFEFSGLIKIIDISRKFFIFKGKKIYGFCIIFNIDTNVLKFDVFWGIYGML